MKKMICKNCGNNNEEGGRFCTSCGAPLEQPSDKPENGPVVAQVYNQGSNYGIFERSIPMAIILSIITCGIYGLYWLYCLAEDTNRVSGDPNAASGGMVILFSIITCGIYSIYWAYKSGETIDNYNRGKGVSTSNNVLYLLLTIFGFGIITYALLQSELNKIAKGY